MIIYLVKQHSLNSFHTWLVSKWILEVIGINFIFEYQIVVMFEYSSHCLDFYTKEWMPQLLKYQYDI